MLTHANKYLFAVAGFAVVAFFGYSATVGERSGAFLLFGLSVGAATLGLVVTGATIGEPVRAVADGVVQFAGADMTGDHPALGLLPRQLKRWRNRTMGPGGFFVRVMHTGGVRSG